MLLNLLQLASPTLPLGGYTYSEGLETLVEMGAIASSAELAQWLNHSLQYGAIQIEAAVMLRAYRCVLAPDLPKLTYWNQWLSASKETSELRQQSWQMGLSLMRLLLELEESQDTSHSAILDLKNCCESLPQPWNYAIAFGIAAAGWQLDEKSALLGYLHSWATNSIGAGIKLIPLGQTVGQKLLRNLHPTLEIVGDRILQLTDDELATCSWGLGLASMNHETQYTRLFRS
jgi:urease accessory protein